MRKLIFFLFLIFFPVVAQATSITVQSSTVTNYYGASTVELRIFLDRAFLTSDNKTLQAGSPANGKVYQKVVCSVVGTTLTINAFTIDSTTDGADVQTAKYSAYFFNTATNQQIQAYQGFESFAIPPLFDTGTTTSWAGIRRYNAVIVPIPRDVSTYSRTEVDAKFAGIQGLTNPMTTLGDIITANSGGTPMRLAGNISTQVQFLTSTGTGSAATTPSYQPLSLALITGGLGYTPVNKAGDTMTGFLTLNANPTSNLHAATKQYVDSAMGGMGTITSINGSATAAQTLTVNATTFPMLTITDSVGDHKFGLSGPIGVAQGGTNKTSFTTGSIPYASASTTIAELAIGAAGTVVKSNGSIPVYGLVDLTANVTGTLPSDKGGTNNAFTAFTGPTTSTKTFTLPNADATILTTNAAVTAVQGGTGQTSYTVGQILYADTTTTLAKRDVGAATTVLHGGTTPSYSAVDLANDTTGTLTVAKGGSGAATFTSGAYLKGNGTSAFSAQATPLPIADLIASPVTNGVVYNGAGALAATSTGATGTVLIGTTASAPSFSASPVVTAITLSGLTQDSIPFVGTSGLITQNNARLAWDNSNFRLNIQGTLRLKGSSAGQTGFIAPATVTGGSGTVIYVLPAADGTNGQALVTDGAGNLSWVTLSGGGGSGITSLNGLTASIQTLTIATTGASSPSITQPTSSQNQIIIPLASASNSAGLVTNASQTISGAKTLDAPITFANNTTSNPAAFFTCSGCAVTTTPQNNAFETDGQFLYYTQSVPSTARKTLAYTDSTISDGQLSANVQLKSERNANNGYLGLNSSGFADLARGGLGTGLVIGASGTFLRSDGSTVGFSADGSALTSLNASNISSGTLSNSRLSGVELTANKGATGGYASLDGSTKVPVAQVSEVLTVTDLTTYNSLSGTGVYAIAATITSPADDQYLAYSGGNWINKTLPAGTSHTLLDGVTVTDSINTTVTRGALVVGNSTPKWTSLTVGSANTVLKSDGTDPSWGTIDLNTFTTGTLAATRGGTGLGSGTSGGLLYFSSSTTIASSSALTANAVLYGAGAGAAPGLVTNNATATTKFLSQVSSGAPTYTTIVNADIAELLAVTDLSTYSSTSGTGTTAILATFTSLTSGDVLTWNGTNWINQVAGGGSAHDILSATHSDSVAASLFRGDLMVGNATPKWARVAIDGANRVLTNNGTDTAWGKVDLTSSSYISGILTATNGGTNNAFFQVSGPATSIKTFTFPNASSTVLTDNAAVTGAQGGTGVVNSGKTITLGGNLTTSGAFALTLTLTNTTGVTLPTTGTLATLAGTESLTNKTFDNTTTFETKDTLFLLQDNTTASKKLAFELSGITAATTRTLTIPDASGTIALTSNNLSAFGATTSAQLAGIISDETGSGLAVFATSPTLTTPTLGVATATSVNKVTITAPATSSTLTIADGSSLITSGANSLTLTTTATTNVTFPSGTKTLVATDVATLSSLASVSTITTGTWQATAITAGFGGTGQSTYTKGDILAASASTTLNKVAVGTDGQMLIADSASAAGVKWSSTAGASVAKYYITSWDAGQLGNISTGFFVNSANEVRVARIRVNQKADITKAIFNCTVNSAATTAYVGIYDSGGTLVVDMGSVSTGTTGVKTITHAATTLNPGVYYVAWSNSSGTPTATSFSQSANVLGVLDANVIIYGVATNTVSAGAMPGTLGTITTISGSANTQIILVKLETD